MEDVKSLAEEPKLVYSIYAIAFIPLTFIYALDFINEKWRPVRSTGRNGVFLLLVSLPSLGCIIAYIVIQIKANDHKEAAAAITIACFNIFHVSRTIWGLVQLYAFRNWNVYALRCLLQMGYLAPAYDYSDDVKDLISRLRGWRPWPSSPSPATTSDSSSSSNNSSSAASSSSVVSSLLLPPPEQSRVILPFKCFKSRCMLLYIWIMGNMEKKNDNMFALHHNSSLDDIKRTVDHHMVVNNSLIDNEFSSAELPVRPALLSRLLSKEPEKGKAISRLVATFLKSPKPEETSVRWLVSFLAKFGHSWVKNTRDLPEKDVGSQTNISRAKLRFSQYVSVVASQHTTHGSVDDSGYTTFFVSLFSPLSKYCTVPSLCRRSSVEITDRCALPFKMKGFNSFGNVLDFDKHEATIRDAAKDDWHKASLNELDESDRNAVENITPVQLACFATLMEEDFNLSDEEEWDPVRIVDESWRYDWSKEDPRTENLLYQLGYDFSKDYNEFFNAMPIRKELIGSVLWNNSPNRLLFQASVHVDNFLALEAGESLAIYLAEQNTSVEPMTPARKMSAFQNQYDLEISRLQSKIPLSPGPRFDINFDIGRFLGCVVETVRTYLAVWVEKHPQVNPGGWKASVAPVGVRFPCSKQLWSAFTEDTWDTGRRNFHMRLLWEAQSYLQWKLDKDSARDDEDIRESPFLIMLSILGFPSLKLEENQDQGSVATVGNGEHAIEFQQEISVKPIGGPQQVHGVLRLDAEAGTVTVELCPDELVFDWQEWKDAFMGRVAAQKYWRQTRLLSKREHLREEAFHSKISSPVKVVSMESLGTDYDFQYWSGWPPCMVQIAQFEVQKLSQFFREKDQGESYSAAGPVGLMQYITDMNRAMDVNFLSGMSPTRLYENANRALRSGRVEEAMKLFGRCIGEHGHKNALNDAVNEVLKKDRVSEAQGIALMFQMDAWFNVLLQRKTTTEQIDFEMLAHYFALLYESTGEANALLQRALALFHKDEVNKPVTSEAIEAIEACLNCEVFDSYANNFKFHLAIAHQSIFHESGDSSQQALAAKYVLSLGTNNGAIDDQFGISIGYLLEKGFYTGHEVKRKDPLFSFFCVNDEWELSERVPKMFDRLFVRPTACRRKPRRDNEQETRSGMAFGIGERPADAIVVYKYMTARREHDDQDCFSQALNRLGMLYHRGAEGISRNASEAEGKYLEAIDLQNIDALCNMGVLKYGNNAEGIDVSYLKKSGQGNSSSGMNNLAIAYELGRCVNRDVVEAEKLYRQAISLDGNPLAIYNLVILYVSGHPQLRNNEKESEAKRVMDDLIRSAAELAPLYNLKDQVLKFSKKAKGNMDTCPRWSVGLEEIDDCLAYVKVLEDDAIGDILGEKQGSVNYLLLS